MRCVKPYYDIVNAPGCGGRVTGMWYNPPYYCIIRGLPPQHSSWARPVVNPYRELSYGGVTFGLFGQNYWIADGYLLSWLFKWL